MSKDVCQLQVTDLSCIRGDRTLFTGLGFVLPAGSVMLVEGANGSGKTTLLRVLSGIRQPDEGTVSWCEQPIAELKGEYQEQLCYLGHQDGVKRDLTAWENLAFALAMGKSSGRSIAEVLTLVGLAQQAEALVAQFSAGQRRRLALARLFLLQARLWILDEPFTSLDRTGIRQMESLFIEHVQQGGMVVMSAHHELTLPGVDVQRVSLSA